MFTKHVHWCLGGSFFRKHLVGPPKRLSQPSLPLTGPSPLPRPRNAPSLAAQVENRLGAPTKGLAQRRSRSVSDVAPRRRGQRHRGRRRAEAIDTRVEEGSMEVEIDLMIS